VEKAIVHRWKGGETDWRTWNLSRERARRLAEAYAITSRPAQETGTGPGRNVNPE